MHRPLSRPRRLIVFSLAVVGLLTVYGATAEAMVGAPLHTLSTPLDVAIPFMPSWVIVYAFVFVQAVAPIFVVTDANALNRTVATYVTVYLISLPVWIFYPVTVPRSPVPIHDLWTFGIGLTRYVDPPTNCMPSMHVALGTVAALVVRRHDHRVGTLLFMSALLITFSTVAIDQHWVLDGVVAIVLSIFADRVCFEWRPLPPEAFERLPRRWHFVWLGVYVGLVAVLASGWFWGWVPTERLPPLLERW